MDGKGIKGLKSVFRRYLRSVCVYGALEQAERKSDTRAEKKTTSARSASVSSSSSALLSLWTSEGGYRHLPLTANIGVQKYDLKLFLNYFFKL